MSDKFGVWKIFSERDKRVLLPKIIAIWITMHHIENSFLSQKKPAVKVVCNATEDQKSTLTVWSWTLFETTLKLVFLSDANTMFLTRIGLFLKQYATIKNGAKTATKNKNWLLKTLSTSCTAAI